MSLLLLFDSYELSSEVEDAYNPARLKRAETARTYMAQGRALTVTAYDTVGVDDVITNSLAGTLHQKLTGEQLVTPTPREIKDWQIRLNLNI